MASVKLWDADTGRELLTVPTRLRAQGATLAFRPDGHTLVFAAAQTRVARATDLAVEVFDGTPR